MNENINLCEILKDCPKGTKLYSPIVGEVILQCIVEKNAYPISTLRTDGLGSTYDFTKEGLYYDNMGECLLFPSKDVRTWEGWKYREPKFDPKTLKPFDRVLVRNYETNKWRCEHFSYFDDGESSPYMASASYEFCIPYNDDTKHLVGTTDEAPEYYRYWED